MLDQDRKPSDFNQDVTWSFAAGASALIAGLAIRRLMQSQWERATDEPAPLNPGAAHVSWPEALTWAALSGVAVAVARVAVRSGVAELWKRKSAMVHQDWRVDRVSA